MEVTPAINCLDFECVKQKINLAQNFLPANGWIHIDVTDARFTFNKTWGNPEEFKALQATAGGLHFEIHLMVEEPEKVIDQWLEAGARRVIVHFEAITQNVKTLSDYHSTIDTIIESCKKYNAKVMLAINPETPIDDMMPYAKKFSCFLMLAVHPGLAGQNFLPAVLAKIKSLREKLPDAKIEVDGGITLETARAAKDAGADIVVSASYILGSGNPKAAYDSLSTL